MGGWMDGELHVKEEFGFRLLDADDVLLNYFGNIYSNYTIRSSSPVHQHSKSPCICLCVRACILFNFLPRQGNRKVGSHAQSTNNSS